MGKNKLFLIACLITFTALIHAQKKLKSLDTIDFIKDDYYFFTLENGSKILAYYIGQPTDDYIELETALGTIIKVHKDDVIKVFKAKPQNMVDGEYWHENSYAHRYMVSPSAFNLSKNEGIWYNGYGFFNALEYGLNKYVSLKAGLNVLLLVDSDQFYYLSAKVGNIKLHDKIYFGTNLFFISQDENTYYNINPMFTLGNLNNNLTLGWSSFRYAGFGHFFEFSYRLEDSAFPQTAGFVNLNAMFRLSRSMYLITENWLSDHYNFDGFNYLGFRYARNLFGMDMGIITSKEIRDEVEFIGLPYITLNYKF